MVPEFSQYQLRDIVELVRAATGWNTSLKELLLWGERGVNLTRAFNIREGLGRKDDVLPDRLHHPIESGAFKGTAIPRKDFAEAVELYYAMRGWDEEGCPGAAKLHELDLGWVVPLLYENTH
jgi:aldehyde:ferredoxin oxidoreductase